MAKIKTDSQRGKLFRAYNALATDHAFTAEKLEMQGKVEESKAAYKRAADYELMMLALFIGSDKEKTIGIIGMGTVALYYRAGHYETAKAIANMLYCTANMPAYIKFRIQEVLYAIDRDESREV